ncbi:dihydrofolate reductase family protein, partial [Demequina sp.]|uniref:dihydrofolate reductase family protein n=1 Tax=Demequina sp. TaxID=2050685 RepID=UPI0025CD907A
MGRLIVEQMVTADGFAAGPGGSLEHLVPPAEGGVDARQARMLEGCDAILLGRVTYEMFADYWPGQTPDDDWIAEPINRLPKHVISNVLAKAPWGDYASATVEHGEPRHTVRRLKEDYQGDIVLWGSLTLTGALLQARLIDQVRLRIVPVVIGEGLRLAPGLRDPRSLTLTEVDTFPTGHVTLVYDVV